MINNKPPKTDGGMNRLLEFQRIISSISTRFVGKTNLDDAIRECLHDICIFSGASRIFLTQFAPNTLTPAKKYEYYNIEPAKENIPRIEPVMFDWYTGKVSNGEIVYIEDISRLPPEACDEKRNLESIGVKAALITPIIIENKVQGCIGLFNIYQPVHWQNDSIEIIKIAAEIITNALRRTAAEAMVQSNEKYFHALIENTVDTIIILDKTGKIKYRSPSIFSMSGYKPDDIIGKSFIDFLHPYDITIANNMFYEGIKTPGKTISTEFRIKNKDGTWTHAIVIGKNALNDPTVEGVILNLRDVTESKRASEKIEHAARQWRATFDSIRDMVWICDEYCTLMRVNKAYAQAAGQEPRALIDKNCYEVLKEAKYICPHCPHKKAIAAGEPVIEIVRIADKYLEITASPVIPSENQPTTSVCVARDITQSRRMEEALINAAQRWRTTFYGIGEGICLTDENGQILQCNQAFSELTGKSLDEIIGHNYEELLIRPIGTAAETSIIDRLKETLIRQKLTLQFDERWFNLVADPIFTDKNEFIGATLVFSDITESKIASEKLQQLYHVETDLRQKLEEEIKSRVELTRLLVHEIKTPLTPILASSEILVDELKEEPWQSLAKNIHTGGVNLNRRIDELLDLARGEVGLLSLNMQELDMNTLLQEVVTYMEPAAKNDKLKFTADLNPLPVIIADEDRLRQVLLNLISNAMKYTPAGGKITLSSHTEKDNVVIEVKDTGSGIEEEEQKQLFQPYYRAVVDRSQFHGLGLGLALSKRLVELHGGKIWLISQRGGGSTFAFSIPLNTPSGA
ncbi:MAG: PAS domain S-box protein [Dehalococcoidales bacterium]|nr:PAS domain S-box protein [Dehalococcoidales bacterium]